MIAAVAATLLADAIRAHPMVVVVLVMAAVVAAWLVWLLTGRAERQDDADEPTTLRPLPPTLRPRGLIYAPKQDDELPPTEEPRP